MANNRYGSRERSEYGRQNRGGRDFDRDYNFSEDYNYTRDYNRDRSAGSDERGGINNYDRESRRGENYWSSDNYGAQGYDNSFATSDRNSSYDYRNGDFRGDGYGRGTSYTSGDSYGRGSSFEGGTSYMGGTSYTGGTSYAGKGPKNWQRSDDSIREQACERLERDPRVDASEIEVSVKDGVITLAGKVDHRSSKRRAEDCVAHLSGVKDVRNELSVDQSFFQQAKEMIMGEPSEKSAAGKGPKRH